MRQRPRFSTVGSAASRTCCLQICSSPGETGRALARKLRLRQPGLKVLFVTGYAEQLRPIEPEGTECLAKPFSSEVLLRKINDLLNSGNDSEEDLSVKHACGTAL